ncbi:hypothetical protein WJX73_007200 [Symbiochloris irregularis]|uniref:Uncharacterized protein n=1 Tax=Symbiochloris irregularis TaxID=706552 RepID=A0AAW1PUM0_9CHLO
MSCRCDLPRLLSDAFSASIKAVNFLADQAGAANTELANTTTLLSEQQAILEQAIEHISDLAQDVTSLSDGQNRGQSGAGRGINWAPLLVVVLEHLGLLPPHAMPSAAKSWESDPQFAAWVQNRK